MQRILIVRLGSLGDLVHALPAVASLRAAYPSGRLDWLVDARHLAFLRLVPIVDTLHEWRPPSWRGWRQALRAIGRLRAVGFDIAVDLQGLMKSATLARASGARRTVGFSANHLRESSARRLYTQAVDPGDVAHVIEKNCALAAALGATAPAREFPITVPDSDVPAIVQRELGRAHARFALLNPGAAWPNKRWPPARFGQLASHILRVHHMRSVVVWGPDERGLAKQVVEAAAGAAVEAPRTSVGDLVALARAATVMVAGDTGPFHIAAALGTSVVGLFGPTNPMHNGPWATRDCTVSRFERCECHHRRRCLAQNWCLESIAVSDVRDAVDRRMEQLGDDA